ncbi:MAG TPA: hypothetical protein VEI96_05315 [Thermodesulfovibrionales bacterium]|nr:hypothetical protein [Thermodesulfovibrionales bacterium]
MKKQDSQEGIALLLVLWVLTILMVIVLSFSFMTKTETSATLSFKDGIEKRFLAEAGIERGIMEVFYRTVNKGQTVILEGLEVWKTDGTPYSDQIGDGSYTVRIIDESGKINLNGLSDGNAIILRQLLINMGVQEDNVNIIVDSILDWKDPNKGMHRLNGAGDEYYESLPNPYEAKHADFDTLEELLLVKGMTPDILYGNAEKRGLIDFLAVIPTSAAPAAGGGFPGAAAGAAVGALININAAPREVLLAVPGMTPEIVESIMSFRETKEIQNPQAEGGIPQDSVKFFSTSGNGPYAIEAVGHREKEKTGYTVKATVALDGNNKYHYLSYKSPATAHHE